MIPFPGVNASARAAVRPHHAFFHQAVYFIFMQPRIQQDLPAVLAQPGRPVADTARSGRQLYRNADVM